MVQPGNRAAQETGPGGDQLAVLPRVWFAPGGDHQHARESDHGGLRLLRRVSSLHSLR